MIKQKDITQINVDSYIRERKRNGNKFIRWSKKTFKFFEKFYQAVVCSAHSVFCDICSEPGMKPKKGVIFMGIKHFW